MKTKSLKPALIAAALASIFVPVVSAAADAELLARIEALNKELQALKAQVQSNQQAQQQSAQAAAAAQAAQAEQSKHVQKLKE